ncbi:SDR family NAD(P)-dependent oxidoreductase [Geminicoccus roseus]|uniref:SDR family NAD(P)-dependent oxidoreductase n=1 Tax=Geminicoccus roseus TaxID=404900 RepID=UPI0003FCAAE4|nr:SDR family NAD(P)-dependent oxidoreductase [Geminicoccus roseus]
MTTPDPSSLPDLSGRVVVVTGASRGIGAAVALEAARLGGRVVLVGRTRGALEELDDEIRALGREPAVLAPVDLTRREHVDALGGMLFERFGRIDLLVHAAGEPGTLTPVSHIDPTELQKVLAVEVIAAQHLIRSFETLLRVSETGRAIFLTCDIAASAPAYFGMAAAAKAGLEALVRSWAAELRQSRVEVVLVDPGRVAGTRTETRRYPGGSREKLPGSAEVAALILATLAQPAGGNDVVRLQSSPRL